MIAVQIFFEQINEKGRKVAGDSGTGDTRLQSQIPVRHTRLLPRLPGNTQQSRAHKGAGPPVHTGGSGSYGRGTSVLLAL